jgi:hypothetical protein
MITMCMMAIAAKSYGFKNLAFCMSATTHKLDDEQNEQSEFCSSFGGLHLMMSEENFAHYRIFEITSLANLVCNS